MSRLQNAVMGQVAFAQGRQAPTLDPSLGGQFGFGNDYQSWVSNSQYIRRNLICRLIEAPRGFQDLPNPDVMVNTLKALVELKCIRIEGLQAQLTVDTQGTPFGGAGEQLENPTNVTRQASEPSFTWNEKYGRPINLFHETWITELIMDPITKYPNVITRDTYKSGPNNDLLPDYYSATMLFIEPDPTHRYVDKAWLCTNMFPKNGGEKVGRKDQTAAGDPLEYNIPYTAVAQVGRGVDQLAQMLLDQINLTGANPNLRPAFVSSVEADVAKQANGYAEQIAASAATAVQP